MSLSPPPPGGVNGRLWVGEKEIKSFTTMVGWPFGWASVWGTPGDDDDRVVLVCLVLCWFVLCWMAFGYPAGTMTTQQLQKPKRHDLTSFTDFTLFCSFYYYHYRTLTFLQNF